MPTIALRRDRLDELRQQRHLHSDSQLADAMALNKSTVSRVLAGKSVPGPLFIAAAVGTFGIAFEDLFEVTPATPGLQPEAVA